MCHHLPYLPVRLLERDEEALEGGEVADELEDSEDLDDPDEVEELAGLPHDVQGLQLVHQDRQQEGQDGQQVRQALQGEQEPEVHAEEKLRWGQMLLFLFDIFQISGKITPIRCKIRGEEKVATLILLDGKNHCMWKQQSMQNSSKYTKMAKWAKDHARFFHSLKVHFAAVL